MVDRKILFISNSDGSIYNFRKDLIVEITSKGAIVDVVSGGSPEGEYYKRFKKLGVLDVACGSTFYQIMTLVRYFLNGKRYDLIHCYTHKGILVGLLSSILFSRRIIATFTGLGRLFDQSGAKVGGKVLVLIYRVFRSRFAYMFFQNNDDADLVLNYTGFPRRNSKVVGGSGIDLRSVKNKKTFNKKVRVAAFVGRTLKSKGVIDFIQAKAIVGDEVEFRIYGSYDKSAGFEDVKSFESYCNDMNVTYHGYADDLLSILAEEVDVVVLPSYYREGVPRSLIEAAACGIPIITCDTVGNRETVVDGVNGFFSETRSPASIAKCVLKMKGKIKSFSLLSRALAEQRFDVLHVNECVLTVYNDILSGKE